MNGDMDMIDCTALLDRQRQIKKRADEEMRRMRRDDCWAAIIVGGMVLFAMMATAAWMFFLGDGK
jgi:hypothetical protein